MGGDGSPPGRTGQGVGVNRFADVDALLRSTSQAFHATVRAALAGDRDHAAEVLAGAPARGELVRTASDSLRARTWVPAPQLRRELQFVAGIAHLASLIDQLADRVAAGGSQPPSPWLTLELSVLLDTGDRRFRQLLDAGCTADLDPTYRGCAAALFEVVDHAAGDQSPTAALCGALATALLQVSRQAAAA